MVIAIPIVLPIAEALGVTIASGGIIYSISQLLGNDSQVVSQSQLVLSAPPRSKIVALNGLYQLVSSVLANAPLDRLTADQVQEVARLRETLTVNSAETRRRAQRLLSSGADLEAPPSSGPFNSLEELRAENQRLNDLTWLRALNPEQYQAWLTQVWTPQSQRLELLEAQASTSTAVAAESTFPFLQAPSLEAILRDDPSSITGRLFIPGLGATPGTGAAAAPTIPGIGGIDESALAKGIAGGLTTALPIALSTAIASTSALTARQHHQARLNCQTSTGLGIASQLLGAAVPLALPFTLLRTELGREVMDRFGGSFFRELIFPDSLPQPATIDTVPAAATQLLLERASFGAAAHVWASTMERFAPAKHMGFQQFGAFLADLAGFNRLATSIQAPVEFNALVQPMRQYAGKLFRSTIPDPIMTQFFYAKKELLVEEMRDIFQRQGYTDHFIRRVEDAAFQDPRLFEMVRIGQFFQPALVPELREPGPRARGWLNERREWLAEIGKTPEDLGGDWFFYYKLMKGGYEMDDVRVMVEVAKRATARREQTLFLDSTTRLYRDGFIGDERLGELVDEAWALDNPVAARIRATKLRAEAQDLKDTADVVLRSMSRGALSEQEATIALQDLGMRPERVRIDVLKERLGLIPRVRFELEGDGEGLLEEGDVDVLGPAF